MASNYSGKFVQINGTWLPSPSTYKMTSSTIVDSSRDTSGYITSTVIRYGVRKIEMSWNFLTQAQFTLIASLFESKFDYSVKYYDTVLGTYSTRRFYAGNRVSENAQMVVEFDNNGNITTIQGYADVKLSLIEV